MKFLRLVLIVFAIGFSTNGNASTEKFTMIDAVSCGKWIEDHDAQPKSWPAALDEAWLVAYLSGLASGLKEDFLKTPDPNSLILWIDNYCRKNPLEDLSDAGNLLGKELILMGTH
jgi:hypothetical protein